MRKPTETGSGRSFSLWRDSLLPATPLTGMRHSFSNTGAMNSFSGFDYLCKLGILAPLNLGEKPNKKRTSVRTAVNEEQNERE